MKSKIKKFLPLVIGLFITLSLSYGYEYFAPLLNIESGTLLEKVMFIIAILPLIAGAAITLETKDG